MSAGSPQRAVTYCMTSWTAAISRVLVILDPTYGERFKDVWPGRAVWITMSSANEPVVRSLWANHPGQDHLSGITGMRFDPSITPEDVFLAQLSSIDLHHGSYSTINPYTELEVVGVHSTAAIREAIAQLEFAKLEERSNGFIARRTERILALFTVGEQLPSPPMAHDAEIDTPQTLCRLRALMAERSTLDPAKAMAWYSTSQ